MKKTALQTIKEIDLLILDCKDEHKETLSKYLRNSLKYLLESLEWEEKMNKESEA